MAKTHCAVTHYQVQDCASRTSPMEDAAMLHFRFEPMSLCFDPQPRSALPPLTCFEWACGFNLLDSILPKLISLLRPHAWFVVLFNIAVPFIPQHNGER